MKLFINTILITLFIFIIMNKLPAQETQTKLDQVELLKQFIGTWKCEYRKDTLLIIENNPFGIGMVSNSKIVTNGETIETIIQLHGYDKEKDRFNVAELIQSTSVLEIINARFISKTSGELVVTNTENAKYQWRFEFKTPDLIVQQAILDDEVLKEVILIREKSNQ
jgi:hypothetical protein